MKRILLSWLLVALLSASVSGQQLLLIGQTAAAAGFNTINQATTSSNQFVIGRYRTGTTFPAQQSTGWGAGSVLSATEFTDNQATPAVVITEGYAENLALWQGGDTGGQNGIAVLQPAITNCTIIGYSTDGWAGNNTVTSEPHIGNPAGSNPDLYHGFLAFGGGGLVRDVHVFGIPGTAMQISRPGDGARNGQLLPYDKLKWVIDHVSAKRVFRGLCFSATDMYASDIEVEGYRDYGVKCEGNSVELERAHIYVGGEAAHTAKGPCFWVTGNDCTLTNCYGENATVGLDVDGNDNVITGFFSHTCSVHNVKLDGNNNKLIGFRELETAPLNLWITAAVQTIETGRIEIASGGTGIKIDDGDRINISDVEIDRAGGPGAGKAIDVNGTLHHCHWNIHVNGPDTVLDMDGGQFGATSANWIWITSHLHAEAATAAAQGFDAPGSENWTTTPSANDPNTHLYINGKRYYQQ